MSLRIRLRTKKRKALRRRRAAQRFNPSKVARVFLRIHTSAKVAASAFTSLANLAGNVRVRFDNLKFNLHPAQRKFFEDSRSFRLFHGR